MDAETKGLVELLRRKSCDPRETSPATCADAAATITRLTAERDEARAERAEAENADLRTAVARSIPDELVDLLLRLGPAEWGATAAKDSEAHGADLTNSVRLTAEHFGQTEPQRMHGLYLQGTEIVLCHTGTSPNSPNVARTLTAAWNYMVERASEARAALTQEAK